jgi:hypothetical protein
MTLGSPGIERGEHRKPLDTHHVGQSAMKRLLEREAILSSFAPAGCPGHGEK